MPSINIKSLLISAEVEGKLFDIEYELGRKFNLIEVSSLIIQNKLDGNIEKQDLYALIKNSRIENIPFIERIIAEKSIIPDGIPVKIEKRKIKIGGEIWYIHKNDADPHPSSPHAHNYEQNITLHLGTGFLFRKREPLNKKISLKNLLYMRSNLKEHSLPQLEYAAA